MLMFTIALLELLGVVDERGRFGVLVSMEAIVAERRREADSLVSVGDGDERYIVGKAVAGTVGDRGMYDIDLRWAGADKTLGDSIPNPPIKAIAGFSVLGMCIGEAGKNDGDLGDLALVMGSGDKSARKFNGRRPGGFFLR